MSMADQKSPLIQSLKDNFEFHAKSGARYLLVYWQGWGETVETRAVKKGQYPWTIHDDYMAKDNAASILAIAFDLQKPFEEQIPDHMRQFRTLEGFAFMPMIHIPDRSGIIPYERQQKERDAILKPKPVMRLVI